MKTFLALSAVTAVVVWIFRPKRPDPDLVKLAGEVGGWYKEAIPG